MRCCACGKTLKTRGNREKCVWYGVCVVWCCEVRKYTIITGNIGKIIKTWSLFWHDLAIQGPKKGPKLATFPNALFLRFPWDLPTILARGLTQTPQNAVFRPRSYSKGPNHALEKVLTKETPGMYIRICKCTCVCVYMCIYVCTYEYVCVCVLCLVFSSCKDATDGELSLRSATSGETLVQ